MDTDVKGELESLERSFRRLVMEHGIWKSSDESVDWHGTKPGATSKILRATHLVMKQMCVV